MITGLNGLRTGVLSGINSLGSVPPLETITSGAALISAMGYSSEPSMLTRFNGTSALPDLAGGDDAFDTYDSDVTTIEDATWGTCAELIENDGDYWCRYSSTSKFDVTTGSFACVVVGRAFSQSTTRFLLGKWSTKGWIFYHNSGANLAFGVYGDSTIARIVSFTDNTPYVATFGVDRAANSQYLYVNALSATGTPPAGSLTNTGRFSLQAPTPNGGKANIALWGYWTGAAAEGITSTHHNNLVSYLGL